MGITKNNAVEQGGLVQHYEEASSESWERYTYSSDCNQIQGKIMPHNDKPTSYIEFGAEALQKGHFEEAETAFGVALRLDRNCAAGYHGLGMVYQQRGNFAEAYKVYLKCLELDKNNLAALSGLFQTSRYVHSFTEVERCLETYLGIHPDDTVIMFCLATLYRKTGQFSRAKAILSDVLVLNPTYKDAADLLEEIEHEIFRRL